MANFKQELLNLQSFISQYEALSTNTILFKDLREAIEDYFSTAEDDSNCDSLYLKFKKVHTSGDVKLAFPAFSKITDTATYGDPDLNAPLNSNWDYFRLYQVLKDSKSVKLRPCFDSLSLAGKRQFNYVVKRRQGYLATQLENLKTNVNNNVSNALYYMNEIKQEYEKLPAKAKNILTEPDREQALILSESSVLLAISETYKRRKVVRNGEELSSYAPIEALADPIYLIAVQEIQGSSLYGQYRQSYETTKYFLDNKELINNLKSKKPAPDDVSLKTFELNSMVGAINAQADEVETKEREDNYTDAKTEAIKLKQLWTSFVAKYKEHNYQSITNDVVEGTRFEEAYKAVNDLYAEATTTIEALTENIDTNYQSLEAVVNYKTQYRLTWKNFRGGYLIGNPTQQNKTDIEELIKRLDVVIGEFASNTNLKDISSLKAKDLTEERKKWSDRLAEVNSILTQKVVWATHVQEAPEFEELEGLTLKPQTFPDDDYRPVRSSSRTKVGVQHEDDSNVIDPNDVNQGNLGDCYFLASVASMALTPDFFYGKDTSVIKIIHPEIQKGKRAGELDMNKIQYFSVRMYLPIDIEKSDPRAGKKDPDTGRTPVNVLVYPSSDLVGSSQLRYAQKADSGELWVAIVERAFAEIRGGYNQLNGGFAEEGYALLMNKKSEDVKRINLDDKADVRKLKIACGNENMTTEAAVTKKLKEALKTSKISIGTPSKSEMLAAGGFAAAGSSLNGDIQIYVYNNNTRSSPTATPDVVLYETHAYSVESESGGKFKIRNPHGNTTTGHTYEQEILFELTGKQIVQFFDSIVIV